MSWRSCGASLSLRVLGANQALLTCSDQTVTRSCDDGQTHIGTTAGGNAPGFSSLSPVAVPLWADPRHLSHLLMVLTAEGRRGTTAEVPLMVMHALTIADALKNMLEATSNDAGYRELTARAAESLRSAAELLEQAPAMARMSIPVDERFTGTASAPKHTRQ